MVACKVYHPVPWDFIYIGYMVSIGVVMHVLTNIYCPLDCVFSIERNSITYGIFKCPTARIRPNPE